MVTSIYMYMKVMVLNWFTLLEEQFGNLRQEPYNTHLPLDKFMIMSRNLSKGRWWYMKINIEYLPRVLESYSQTRCLTIEEWLDK